jgi:hypothetical protein
MHSHVGATWKDELIDSACRFAQQALRAWTAHPRRLDRFFLNAGTSLEHLAKAYLASIHPSLIVDPRHFGSLLYACGRPDLAGTPATTIRTITVTEAIRRCILLLPRQLQGLDGEQHLGPLIEARNSVAHIGRAAEARVASQAVIPYLRTVTVLGEALGVSPASLWSDHAQYVATHLSDSATKTQQAVMSRVARARVTFHERYGRLQPSQRELLLSTIVASYQRSPSGVEHYDQELLVCPACSTEVMVQGTSTVDWGKTDHNTKDGAPHVSGALPVIIFLPTRLECQACGLRLSGQDEMQAGGLEPVKLDVHTIDELLEDVEGLTEEPFDSAPVEQTDSLS